MPEPWHIGSGGPGTHSPDYTTLYVYDGIYEALGPLKRPKWVRARDAALGEWSVLKFKVEQRFYPDSERSDKGIIVMRPSVVPLPGGQVGQGSYTGCYTMPEGEVCARRGVTLFDLARLQTYRVRTQRAVVAHEIGHALGFAHDVGGTGIMAYGYSPVSTGHVSEEELQVTKDWYA